MRARAPLAVLAGILLAGCETDSASPRPEPPDPSELVVAPPSALGAYALEGIASARSRPPSDPERAVPGDGGAPAVPKTKSRGVSL